MTHLSFRSLAWLAPVVLLAASCGEPSEPGVCEDVTCGANASCTTGGACVCDEGFVGDAKVGCTAAESCTATSCSSHGTCDASSGSVVCTCDEGYTGATCLTCADGYEKVGNACVASDACKDLACGDHGSCRVVGGTASCNCDEGYEGTACDQCADGYKADGSLCVVDDPCEGISCDANEVCVVDGGNASCECAPGYASEHGECLNQKWVDCTDAAPANATSKVEPKQVIWNPDTGAWSTVGACDWACNADYFETEGGRCINTRTENCDASGTLPEHASFLEIPVTLTYTTAGGWPSVPACEWVCSGDRARDGGACVSEKYVSCARSGIANAVDDVVDVLVTYTAAGGWTQPAACTWACKTDYVDFEEQGACINERLVTCDPTGVVVPDHAEIDLADVTISYTTAGGWTTAQCGWKCLSAYGQVGEECLSEKQVDCDGSNPPVNQAPIVTPVTVAWDEALQTWAAPAACEFECAAGFADYDEDGACENTFSVACDATSTPADATADHEVFVEITFDGSAWSAPGACPWTCHEGFFAKDGACVEATIVNSCLLLDTAHETTPGQAVDVSGYVDFTGAGVIAKLCVARPSFSAPVSMSALDCVDAAFDSEDAETQQYFKAQASTASVGVFEYAYAFSGDEGGTWTLCDGEGAFDAATGPTEPGVLTVRKGINEQIADVRAAREGTTLSLPVEGALVTYVRPKVGEETSGFFVQGSREGPALFVVLATDLPTVGDRVNFTVTETDHSSRDQISVTKLTGLTVVGTGNPEDFVQDLSAATDVVTALGNYDNELVRLTGTFAAEPVTAGNYHSGVKFVTAGVNSSLLQLRLPNTLLSTLPFQVGCQVTVTGPMWRFGNTAQPSAYDAADLTDYECPGPKVTGAKSTKQTTVVVTFDKPIDESLLGDVAEHFLIEPPLELLSMSVSGDTVMLTTAAQVEDELYTLLVADVFDLHGNALEEDFNTATFTGRGTSTNLCEWKPPVVISQLYPGGGTTGATYKSDFIELYNRGGVDISLDGWSLQRTSATGGWGLVSNPEQFMALSGVIKANSFLLITMAPGTTGTPITGDLTGKLNFGKDQGKVALVAGTTALTATCPATSQWVDFVGYGTTANCALGTRTANLVSTMSLRRPEATLCDDPTSNATDFTLGAPVPRNASTVVPTCVCE